MSADMSLRTGLCIVVLEAVACWQMRTRQIGSMGRRWQGWGDRVRQARWQTGDGLDGRKMDRRVDRGMADERTDWRKERWSDELTDWRILWDLINLRPLIWKFIWGGIVDVDYKQSNWSPRRIIHIVDCTLRNQKRVGCWLLKLFSDMSDCAKCLYINTLSDYNQTRLTAANVWT